MNRFLGALRPVLDFIYPWLDGFLGIFNGIWVGAILCFVWLMSPALAGALAAAAVVITFAIHGKVHGITTTASAILTILAAFWFFGIGASQ